MLGHVSVLHYSVVGCNSIVWICHILLPVNHLWGFGLFLLSGLMNSTTMNICIQVFVRMYFFNSHGNLVVTVFNILKKCQTVFQIVAQSLRPVKENQSLTVVRAVKKNIIQYYCNREKETSV